MWCVDLYCMICVNAIEMDKAAHKLNENESLFLIVLMDYMLFKLHFRYTSCGVCSVYLLLSGSWEKKYYSERIIVMEPHSHHGQQEDLTLSGRLISHKEVSVVTLPYILILNCIRKNLLIWNKSIYIFPKLLFSGTKLHMCLRDVRERFGFYLQEGWTPICRWIFYPGWNCLMN